MRRILVLRPEPGATATVERARARGLDAAALPLFEIEAIAWEPPDPSGYDALLLTSANAVRHGGGGLAALQRLPVHAVGDATAEMARGAGFRIASAGMSGVEALLGSLQPGLRLLHLSGEDRTAPAAPLQEITALPVYRARERAMALDLRDAESSIALVHSPRAGRRFAELIDAAGIDRNAIAIAAISAGAAMAAGSGWEARVASESPDDDALLALAASLCNNPAGT